ncbi:unnamed protein product [Gemmata massiliana]|uniref:Uncharacterized protein n=1 Tax=Gemmata massiliana TaxID=1210884 RepID=A0A6P2DMB9_9BACT|nr:hypothetical protein [Gemmata massiliana]VTS02996.1 unnamed protein product [Gemmata massiliana]
MSSQLETSPHHRADVEVSQDGAKVTLKAPAGGATLTSDEAQELASRIFEAAARASGDDPVENDWVRLPMQYLRLTAERLDFAPDGDENKVPAPNSDEPDGSAAEVHCWIKDQTQGNAVHIAAGNVTEHGWYITEVLEHQGVTRADFADSEYLQYFEKALVESEVFLYEIEEESETEGSDDA